MRTLRLRRRASCAASTPSWTSASAGGRSAARPGRLADRSACVCGAAEPARVWPQRAPSLPGTDGVRAGQSGCAGQGLGSSCSSTAGRCFVSRLGCRAGCKSKAAEK
jgi:hypothetical protein